jgi:hypothetical protein
VIRRIIERGQEAGDFRRDLDAETAAIVFYGGVDELISGWVLGRLAGDERHVADAERHVVEMLTTALAADELREPRGADVPA